MELTAREIVEITGGVLLAGAPTARASSFAIDSRTLTPGACFVALRAERDGHHFVADAVARGAAVAVVARADVAEASAPAAVVRVDDPLAALGRLGARARAGLARASVVGITGSAGKTGTKDLTAAALGGPPRVHASPGSYNNEAGVPLTLLDAPERATAVVLELGARAHGDIAMLCTIARPSVGVITNIGSAHAGLLGGTEGIARAKGELIEALPDDGLAVLDADDAFTERIAARAPAGTRILRVSARGTHGADVVASGIKLDHEVRPSFTLETPWGRAPVRLGVHGDHQVVNALLAAAVALDRGVALAAAVAGLERVRPAPWRMEVLRTPAGAIVLNDAYNANPASTEAALRAFVEIDTAGRRVAVLGEMRELGTHSADEHARIGHLVGELGIDVVVVVGPEAEPLAAAAKAHPDVEVRVATDAEHALDEVRAALRADDDAVLVKASRAVGLERVAHALTEPVGRSGTEPVGRSGTEPVGRSGTEPA